MPTALEGDFHDAMVNIYRRAKSECDYNATRFLGMLADHGGLTTAQILLHAPAVSDGYTALWQCGRLDLTVEALVVDAKWSTLFTLNELKIAKQRLIDYGYSPSP